MYDMSNYNVYTNKDGRTRIYNKTTHTVTSYPRFLMEQKLGRKLLKTEDVHHIDENPLNNSFDNLEVVDHKEHDRKHAENNIFSKNKKYTQKEMICPVCGKIFIWSTNAQSLYYCIKQIRGPYCSRSCAGKETGALANKKQKRAVAQLVDSHQT